MLTVRDLNDRTVEITLAGVIDTADIDTMKRDLTPRLEAADGLGIVIRAEALEDMTADAIAEEARFEFGMLPRWAKLDRVALVTDKQAFEAILRWIDPLLPTIAIRTFAPADAAAAAAWAGGTAPDAAEAGPGLRVTEDGSDGLVAFEIDGRMTEAGVRQAMEVFERAVGRHGSVNLLVHMKDYAGFDPGLLADPDFFAFKVAALGKMRRYAVVGAPAWMGMAMKAMAPVLPVEMRAFDDSEADAARAWARAP